ncbi:TolC family protein [Aestuariibaculum lutulentum]|uniref:TolC family protein n=1 Tax=Aestuariibaculum lutulentum TaxID=2920935 RepID=A0ABS9RJJ5_9FLAO|nr:TolC family protein [Aestuariibaculum lutulentum]MCH4552319.1 TolC family protein [Aestuariibaculum lutulentum]
MKVSYITYKHYNKGLLVVLLAFVFQGCFVAKNYERPELEETEDLFRTDNLPTDSLSMADVSWKELFTDEYLQKYIDSALQNNLDIRIAIQQIAISQAYLKQGKAGYFPTLNGSASASRTYFSENSQQGIVLTPLGRDHVDQFDLSGTMAWEADIWGKIRSTKRAYEAGLLQSVAAHQAVKTQLVSLIASTYYQLLALDAQLEITKQTVVTREKGVETIKALKEAGQVTQVAVDQNIAQYNSAKVLEVDLEAAIFKAENTLSILLGITPQNFERSHLDSQHIDTELKLGVPATLLSNRPDVMQAEYGLIQSFELSNVARSYYYPSLTLTASGGLQSLNSNNWFDASSLFVSMLGGLTQPIFNGRQIRTQNEVAKAQQEQALLNFKKTILVAGTEVSNALYMYNAEITKYDFVKNQVEALRKAEENSDELLQNGFGTYLDLLTARENVLNAELNIIDNKLQQLLSIINLYQALGGGWK